MESYVGNGRENLTPKQKNGVEEQTVVNLVKSLNEGEKLKELLKWYFHMVDNSENISLLVENLGNYEKSVEELHEFADTPFMDETIYEGYRTCGIRLRELMIPFVFHVDMIIKVKNGGILDDEDKRILESFPMNKEEMQKFCSFLEKKSLD